jgi:hypothetical protein
MSNRSAVLLLTSLGLVAGVTAPAEQVALVATGTVMKKSADTLVVRTHDHGHMITFSLARDTGLPDGLAVGKHIEIDYHANGSTGQTADRITLIAPRATGRVPTSDPGTDDQ